MADARAALTRAARRYSETLQKHEDARAEVLAAVVDALRAGVPPTEVADLSPFTTAYVRRVAREHNIPPAPPGIKPRR